MAGRSVGIVFDILAGSAIPSVFLGVPRVTLRIVVVSPPRASSALIDFSSRRTSFRATVLPTGMNFANWTFNPAIPPVTVPSSTSRSSDQRTACIPCTTADPAWVLRAASGSKCIGFRSPDRRAKKTWSSLSNVFDASVALTMRAIAASP